jgi:hypothetical protein
MISVNFVRNIVLALLEKNNYGYLKPDAFNMLCTMAQQDLFENLFYQYTAWLNKENKRLTGSEYANIPKNIREQIDVFSTYTDNTNFTYDLASGLWSYSGTDLYRAEYLSLINAQGRKVEIEEVKKSELDRLQNGNLISATYPIYTRIGDKFKIAPQVQSGYTVELFFIRKPKDVKWCYVNVNGNAVFNASDPLLQDIELHISLLVPFIVKVLGYAGLTIREQEVEQMAQTEEVKLLQKQA